MNIKTLFHSYFNSKITYSFIYFLDFILRVYNNFRFFHVTIYYCTVQIFTRIFNFILKNSSFEIFLKDAVAKGAQLKTKDSLGWADPRSLKTYLESEGYSSWIDFEQGKFRSKPIIKSMIS